MPADIPRWACSPGPGTTYGSVDGDRSLGTGHSDGQMVNINGQWSDINRDRYLYDRRSKSNGEGLWEGVGKDQKGKTWHMVYCLIEGEKLDGQLRWYNSKIPRARTRMKTVGLTNQNH